MKCITTLKTLLHLVSVVCLSTQSLIIIIDVYIGHLKLLIYIG